VAKKEVSLCQCKTFKIIVPKEGSLLLQVLLNWLAWGKSKSFQTCMHFYIEKAFEASRGQEVH